MRSRCSVTGSDVVTLSNDFSGMERKSSFLVTRSYPEAKTSPLIHSAKIARWGPRDDGFTAGGLVLCRAGRPEYDGQLRACRRRGRSVS